MQCGTVSVGVGGQAPVMGRSLRTARRYVSNIAQGSQGNASLLIRLQRHDERLAELAVPKRHLHWPTTLGLPHFSAEFQNKPASGWHQVQVLGLVSPLDFVEGDAVRCRNCLKFATVGEIADLGPEYKFQRRQSGGDLEVVDGLTVFKEWEVGDFAAGGDTIQVSRTNFQNHFLQTFQRHRFATGEQSGANQQLSFSTRKQRFAIDMQARQQGVLFGLMIELIEA